MRCKQVAKKEKKKKKKKERKIIASHRIMNLDKALV
jgi:hypothetical protein